MVFGRQSIGTVPPATAQRLKQAGGIRETTPLCLHQRQASLLISLLGIQQREIGDLAKSKLATHDLKAASSGLL
jgi:hypothetical protein